MRSPDDVRYVEVTFSGVVHRMAVTPKVLFAERAHDEVSVRGEHRFAAPT